MHTVSMPFEKASTAGPGNPNFLSNEVLSPWLRISDCSQVSDGASAMILASEEGLKTLGKQKMDALEILACVGAAASIAEDANPFGLLAGPVNSCGRRCTHIDPKLNLARGAFTPQSRFLHIG